MVFLSFPFDLLFYFFSLVIFSNVKYINVVILYLLWFPSGSGCVLPVASGGKREFYYSADPALLAEPAQNSFVVENEEQRLRMRLPEAQLERERQDSARLSARRSCSRGRKRSRMSLSSSSSFLSLCLVFVFLT